MVPTHLELSTAKTNQRSGHWAAESMNCYRHFSPHKRPHDLHNARPGPPQPKISNLDNRGMSGRRDPPSQTTPRKGAERQPHPHTPPPPY